MNMRRKIIPLTRSYFFKYWKAHTSAHDMPPKMFPNVTQNAPEHNIRGKRENVPEKDVSGTSVPCSRKLKPFQEDLFMFPKIEIFQENLFLFLFHNIFQKLGNMFPKFWGTCNPADLISRKEVTIKCYSTGKMLADYFRKPLVSKIFRMMKREIMNIALSE